MPSHSALTPIPHLALAEVDLCLIPEVPVVLEGRTSILAHLERVLARQGHAVVVVAEGAGEELLTAEKLARGEPVEVRATHTTRPPRRRRRGRSPRYCPLMRRLQLPHSPLPRLS